jgi:exodeoxyribonuclease V alpha subunit
MTKAATAGVRSSLRGVVETVFYSGPTFTAGRLRTPEGALVSFAGKVFAKPNDPVRLEGEWTNHPKYGRQFAVEALGYDLEMDPDGLANFLANHPDVKGIGPAKARLIADQFGSGFDAAIRTRPSTVAAAAKVPLDLVLPLQRIWIANSAFNAAMTYLSRFGLTHHQVTTLVERFGSQVVPILERDPYVLIREISGFGFKRVDKIARKMGAPKDLPSRIRAGIQYCVLDALDDGDCWIEYEDLLDRANTLLVMDTLDSREVIEGYLEVLIAEGHLVSQPFERLVVADPEIHRMEHELADILRTAGAPSPHAVTDPDGLLDAEGALLNREQRDAVKNTLTYSISLTTGGAGSGKTYAVSTITTIAGRLEKRVVLAAPTGKAAKRLEQVVGHEASTIHRLLGFNGRTYSRDGLNPIEADVLVVDEVSMVDVPLAWRLFQAIDRTKTAVVLVGDHNQLPPVGPGNLLRDLVKSRAIPTTVLTQIIRQAGVLKENSTAILSGEVRPTAEVKNGARRPWYVVDKFTDTSDVQRMLLLLFGEVLQERLSYDLVRDVQVLTPTHRGPLGTVELNLEMQRLLQKKLFGFDVPDVEHGHRPRLYPGDKVIQMKNDYELGVMNGAMGIVMEVDAKGGLTIDFDGRPVEIEAGTDGAGNVQLAYATSIHKVQGSEFPCAVVVAHKSHSFMHHRNLLYTAVTRAKDAVILLGDRWGMENCATKRQVDRRNTFLSFLLHPGADSAAGVFRQGRED